MLRGTALQLSIPAFALTRRSWETQRLLHANERPVPVSYITSACMLMEVRMKTENRNGSDKINGIFGFSSGTPKMREE